MRFIRVRRRRLDRGWTAIKDNETVLGSEDNASILVTAEEISPEQIDPKLRCRLEDGFGGGGGG